MKARVELNGPDHLSVSQSALQSRGSRGYFEWRVGRDVERNRAFAYVRCTAISCTSLTRVSNRALANASCVLGLRVSYIDTTKETYIRL